MLPSIVDAIEANLHVLSQNLSTAGNYCAPTTESLAELPSKFRDIAPSHAALVRPEHNGPKLIATIPASRALSGTLDELAIRINELVRKKAALQLSEVRQETSRCEMTSGLK